jgi:hypothetical protein
VSIPDEDDSFQSGPMPVIDSNQQTSVGEIIHPKQIADGVFDLGSILFPDPDVFLSARVLSGNHILIWTMNIYDESLVYDYSTGEVLYRFSPSVRRLGMEHFYSRRQNSENSYTIALYDKDYNVLAQHETSKPAIPAIDGINILYDAREKIAMRNTLTNEEMEISISDIASEYEGGIVFWGFDGQWVFFNANYAPFGTPHPFADDTSWELWSRGVGAYNIITGASFLTGRFDHELFVGIPESFGESKAIFWQCGCAHGTDGTNSVIIDAENSDMRIADVGGHVNRMSDNGRFLVAVDGEWDVNRFDFQTITLTTINIYDGHTYELISSRDFGHLTTIEADGGGHFDRVSISDDGRHVFFTGLIEENGNKRQSLFMVDMDVR